MKTLLLLLAFVAAASPAAAYAGTAGFDGEDFTYTAAPGEANGIGAKTTDACGELPRRICKLLERSIAPCRPLSGGRRKRCLKRAARKAAAGCRARFKGRARAKCVRSVRRLE